MKKKKKIFFFFVFSSSTVFFPPFSQVLGESLYISGKYLNYEEKYVVAKSKVESLSADNDSLKVRSLLLLTRPRKTRIV